jgi:hypothetical protein
VFPNSVKLANQHIKKSRRAIVSFGCSFVEGQGAVDEKIWDLKSLYDSNDQMHEWNLPVEIKKKIVEEYPDVTLSLTNQLDFSLHQYKNTFVYALANKYFNGEYAAINFGRAGNGNRASIKEIYYYPGIEWDSIDEIIVVYCPSGVERFDFMYDGYKHLINKHPRFVTMWPGTDDQGGVRTKLWESYEAALYSYKFAILEQINHIQELLLWCKYKKAKLIITPAFNRNYTKEYFLEQIATDIKRDDRQKMLEERKIEIDNDVKDIVNMWPWDNMFSPDGHPTFADLVMAQEPVFDKNWEMQFYSYLKKGTPEKWFTPCAHPSVKGHDLFAKVLHKHIVENL